MLEGIHKVKYGRTERWSFNKIRDAEIPYFIEVQKDSYKKFIEKGIREVFQDYSPMKDHNGRMELEFVDYRFDKAPKYSVKECKDRDATYAVPMKVKVRLIDSATGDVQESEVYMGDIPLMTDNGSFIINGAERVIVSQLVRSPGVYCANEVDKNGTDCFSTTIMPNRGAWIELEQDSNGLLWVKVDRQRKISTTVFLKAMSELDEAGLKALFGNHPKLLDTLNKDTSKRVDECKVEFFRRLKTGEIPSIEAITTHINNIFFERRRYDFNRVGRFKTNQKLCLATRITGATVAADVIDESTGEVVLERGKIVTAEMARYIQNLGINRVSLTTGEEPFMCIGNNTVEIKEYLGEEYEDVDFEELGILEPYVYYPTLKELYENRGKKEEFVVTLTENAAKLYVRHLTIDDILAAVSYNLGMQYGFGSTDFIDHLCNRRVRSVGELLQTHFATGMNRLEKFAKEKMATTPDFNELKPDKLINIRPMSTAIREFFGSSQLSQFMDQPNPIAELTHKRKLSALGPGGLNRERASVEVRDVHHSHYGRMCPIETPEGQNIGLITSLSTYARVNDYGFIETPYRKVDKSGARPVVTDIIEYLSADKEDNFVVAQANEPLDSENHFIHDRVACRDQEDILELPPEKVDYMDVSPKQLISVATSLIPFLENDDTNRALMGSNMQRQAVPLLRPEAPMIGTGIEYRVAYDSGVMQIAKRAGEVTYVSSERIDVRAEDGSVDTYGLQKFERSNQGTCINQKPIVTKGQYIPKGEILADGPSTQNGELALGRNILIGFMTWEGYNYEDAILISEDLVKDDVFTSIHIEEYSTEARDTKLGVEEITRDIPNVNEDSLKDLGDDGIIRIGAAVRAGDILVGKTTPKGETEPSPDERLLKAIFGEKSKDVRDTSLKVPHGVSGVVVDVKVFTRENKDELQAGVKKMVIVSIAQKRKISVGDKMAGRHGNKGVISRVLPREDMPFMADGTPLQIVLNPLGVPSRMNIGQVLEVHLGLVSKMLDWKVATPVFDGATEHDIKQLFQENYLPEDGKMQLYDGRTGEPFENKVTVGYMYMLKLVHLVDDKIHARSTGPYSLVTQQPLGGKAQFGGQRFGEMEVWALEAYGAAHILQEIITVKSDDVEGRNKACASIVKGMNISEPGIPESFKVLIKELQSLALDVKVLTENNMEIGVSDFIQEDTTADIHRIGHSDVDTKELDIVGDEFDDSGANVNLFDDDEDVFKIIDDDDSFVSLRDVGTDLFKSDDDDWYNDDNK